MAAEIIGREAELRILETFLDDARHGSVALLLRGEAGMGKTTLWSHCVGVADAAGTRVLACRPSASERQLAFAGLSDLLADVAGEVLPSLPAPQRRALEVALLLDESGNEPPEPRVIAAAFHSTIRAFARSDLTLVAVDDVQWLDRPTAAVLEFAARRLDHDPVGLLLAQRIEGSAASTPLGLERAFADELRAVDVGPLSLGDVGNLLRSKLGAPLPRPLVHRIFETSGGNPFYALELGRALAQRGEVDPGQPLPVPATLEGLVRERLEGLSSAVQGALEIVAALSDPTIDVVRDTLGPDAGAAIDEAVADGVLTAKGNRLRFSHPLIASAVYSRLGPHERQMLHARLANVVIDPEERAHQLALATTSPDEGVAATIEHAARRAAGRGAPMVAAALLERAIQLTPEPKRGARRRRVRLLTDLSVVDGDVLRAAGLAEELVQDARAEERLDALADLAIVRLSEGERSAVSVLVDEILAASGPDDRARAVALILSSTVDVRRLGRRETLARGREAVAIGERIGDLDIVRDALVNASVDAAWLGEPFVADIERAAAMGDIAGIFPVGHHSESVAHETRMWFADELDATRPALLERYETAVAYGSAEAQAEALVTLSELERRAGRLHEADVYGSKGLDLGDVYIRATLCFTTGYARALQGRLDEAERLASEGLEVAENAPANAALLLRWLLGLVALFQDRAGEAVEHLRELPDLGRALGVENPTPLQFHPDVIETLVEAGAVDEAEPVVAWLEERGRAVGHPWAVAAALRCRGVVLAAQGDVGAALPHLDEAVQVSTVIASERPLEHGRALLTQGATLRRAKKRKVARDALARALEIFDELGAAVWADRAAAELGRIPGRSPSTGELTETERRVAELVAAGLSNKEVAARLFVTVRTVEANLTKVYAKLGIRSRTELASRLRA